MSDKTKIDSNGVSICISNKDPEIITQIDSLAHKILNNGRLIYLCGKNKLGEYGLWIDEDGLCEHEHVSKYCEFCK